jgi:hypothetical protein
LSPTWKREGSRRGARGERKATVAGIVDEQEREIGQLRGQLAEETQGRAKAETNLAAMKATAGKAADVIQVRVFGTERSGSPQPRPLQIGQGWLRARDVVAVADALCTLDLDSFSGEYDGAFRVVPAGGSEIFVDLGEGGSADSTESFPAKTF